MKTYYSPGTKGFYSPAIHKSIPDDAVEISAEEHKELIAAQSEGKIIQYSPSEDKVIAVDPEGPSKDQKIERCKREADRRLRDTDWAILVDAQTRLKNSDDFVAYRDAVRKLRVTPVENPEWPELPKAEWN
jgi:hypothetical protein